MTAVLLIQLGIKGALILLAAWALTAMMRRASASSRHLVWAVAIVTTLAMPLVPILGPSWHVVIPVERTGPVEDPAPIPGGTSSPIEMAALPETSVAIESSPHPATEARSPLGLWDFGFGLWDFSVALWACGALLLLFRLAHGIWRTRGIAQRAAPVVDAEWLTVYDEAAAALCVASPVQLRQTDETKVPVACGIARPAILLPVEAADWSRERRLVVLLHELAHVRRRDCLLQAMARVTCALHWVNPLAHLAVSRLRSEQERACDDLVLTAGAAAPAYADHLFDIARSFRSPGVPEWATLAMARPSQLEGRLTAILDGECNRQPLARRLRVAIGIAAVTAIVGLGALRVSAAYVSGASGSEIQPERTWLVAAPARQAPAPTPAPAPQPAPRPAAPVSPAPPSPTQVTPPAPPQPMRSAVPARPAQPFPRNPQVSDDVRRRVADALATALNDENPDVRRQALNALTSMRDQRAVPALMKALRDPSPDLRESALQALAQFNVPEAYDAIVVALRDENADVREQAVAAVGRSGRPQAVSTLIPMLKDPVADVRQRAAMALGNIADPAAIDPLTVALKDPDADVREQAALALARIAQGPRRGAAQWIGDWEAEAKRLEGQTKELEKAIEASFGKDFEKRMEKWGEDFGTSLGAFIEGVVGPK